MSYAIKVGERHYGPFKTALAAGKWAERNLDRATNFAIIPLRVP